MGIHIMPGRWPAWIVRNLFRIDSRAYSAKKIVEDAYARTNARPSPDLKKAYLAYKIAERAREGTNRSG